MEQIIRAVVILTIIVMILYLLPHNKQQIPILIMIIEQLLKVLRSCCKKLLIPLHRLPGSCIFLNPHLPLLQSLNGVIINLIYCIQYHKKLKTLLISAWAMHLICHRGITSQTTRRSNINRRMILNTMMVWDSLNSRSTIRHTITNSNRFSWRSAKMNG